MERSALHPAQCHGEWGDPWRGGSGKGPGTFRTDLLEGLPNSFPNIAPGRPPGSQLLRVPFTQPGQPGGNGDGLTPWKHAWKLQG